MPVPNGSWVEHRTGFRRNPVLRTNLGFEFSNIRVAEYITVLYSAPNSELYTQSEANREDDTDHPNKQDLRYSLNGQLKGLAVRKEGLDRLGKLNEDISRVFMDCLRSLRLKR